MLAFILSLFTPFSLSSLSVFGLISCELMLQCFEITTRTATMIAPLG